MLVRNSIRAVIRFQSFEPGEDWFYDWRSGAKFGGHVLEAPESHPVAKAFWGQLIVFHTIGKPS
jgi:hypothetical protein